MPKKLRWLRSPTGSNGRCGWRIVISPKDSSGFSVLLRFFDAQSGRSFHPFHRRPGSVARSWRGPFPRCGVASAQAPDPDLESLPEYVLESVYRDEMHLPPRRLAKRRICARVDFLMAEKCRISRGESDRPPDI